MLKQLKETVVSAISSNPLNAYELDTSGTTLCGRSDLFEKCDAVVRANGKKVSIFTLRIKRVLERCTASEALALIKVVKESVALLTHMRHPGILSIEGQLVEDKKKIWFAAERVSMVLAPENVQGLPLQVKLLGLFHCAEAIRFLHEKAELLLFNFALSSIYVTEDNQWKIGDLCFAVPRAQLSAPPPPPFPFHSVAAPLLDYLPTEYVQFCTKKDDAANRDLFSAGAAPLVYPDSDTYGFLVVTVEVLQGKRLFNCCGNPQEQQRQLSAVEGHISRYFPAAALRLPRPPISTVVVTGPFATPDMKTLTGLFSFGILDSDPRFRLLKALYDGLTKGDFCEAVILSGIVPLMVQESKVDAMLRFVLPILLLCAGTLSTSSFHRTLREYFVSLLTAIIRAPSLQPAAVYAEQILQKRECIHKHFASVEDKATLIVPLILKLMPSEGNERLQKGSLEWFRDVLTQTPTIKLGLPKDIAARLLNVASSNADSFALAFQCLEKILTFSATETKMDVEVNLTRTISNTAISFTSVQLDYMLGLLRGIQEKMNPEHRAVKSIPLLCPLLLHTDGTVRQFAVASIVRYAQLLGSGPAPATAPLPPPPSSGGSFSSSAANSGAPAALAGSLTQHALPPSAAPPPARADDDVFASLFS
ncbi:hypothetical protein, unknown function [Leishmania mexicana MHOM/GT/2001/U1103]|uniref:Protein kinase domain-containing protein n=1 Tax=Leishmania mexicana (strain MHOM/GT/2001/U1103) TaxID=929439 RepID=E9ASD2_LEIMU|nr:hypothetical protein, unknown function [Leishmania mexicana MHOM/GT/2001/U1103]CBZ25854.1 hypothetical protein, unknown function [Leishmania mexicana MHOM/GT/2001/U1103]